MASKFKIKKTFFSKRIIDFYAKFVFYNLPYMRYYILLLVVVANIFQLSAQEEKEKKKEKKEAPVAFDNAFIISPNYSFQLPLNDMYHSYGFNHNVGMELGYKFGKNLWFSVEGNFLFGGKIKEKKLLSNLLTSNGLLIGKDGSLETVNMSSRGMLLTAKFGKTFYFGYKKPNSGLQIKVGAGYIDHRIYINVNERNVPQLSDDLRKGYDRFCSGVAFTQYVGLIHLERKSFLNVAFGIEAMQGITQNRRPFDFKTGKTLNKTRFDFLIGFKFSYIIPVFRGTNSKATEYYYY